MRFLVVFGTRPEAIKLAPVIRELRARKADCTVCVTGQHRQMLDQVLKLFGITPDIDLDLMRDNQTPTQVAARVLEQLGPAIDRVRPDWVVVQGDTTTVMAASIAAFYARVRVAHVEAGLRSGDKWRPFPEEINRRLAGVTADLHLAPTERSRANLLREGVPDEAIAVTGNPVIDALQWAAGMPFDLRATPGLDPAALEPDTRLVLVTAHRRESFGAPLREICGALGDIARARAARAHVIYAVHPNPNVAGPVHELLAGQPGVTLLPPLDYLPLVQLMKRASLVLTDSGGIQEEAPSLGVPVLVLRDVTERPEAVEAGTVRLVGADRRRIADEALRILTDPHARLAMARAVNPYGDGRAAERIVSALLGEDYPPFHPASPGLH